MDFNLTEERAMLRDMLQRFLAENYDHEARRKLIASGGVYDAEIYDQLAELGIIGALFDEEQGGFGGTGFDIAVVFEELGRAGVIEPVLPAMLAGELIAKLGDAAQKTLIDDLIAGQKILSLAHGEQGVRYDLNEVSTTATTKAGALVLNGRKTHVLNGAQSDLLIVSARESGDADARDGISLFLVPVDAKGVTIVSHMNIDGTCSATVTLTDVVAERLGAPSAGLVAVEEAVARASLAVCAESLGAMEAAKALTIDYLKERKQFGIPIGKFQALQHRTADMLIEIEQARSAVINLAGHMDHAGVLRDRHVSATKNLIGRVGALVAEECIQMHGGIGMTDEYALSHFARRIVMIDHLFGDVDFHLERFIQLNAA